MDNKIVEFDKNDKWLVAAEKTIDDIKYSYLIRVNEKEDDILNEFQVVRNYDYEGEEYMDQVTDQELLKKIIPELVPEAAKYIDNPEKIDELIQEVA